MAKLAPLFAKPPLKDTVLAIDRTGGGRPVTDMITKAKLEALLRPITITGGHAVSRDTEDGGWNVPKKDLVGAMQVLLQSQRIEIAAPLAEADALTRELLNFRVKVTLAANEQFGARREGTHDDLVLAVAMAVWCGQRFPDEIAFEEQVEIEGHSLAIAQVPGENDPGHRKPSEGLVPTIQCRDNAKRAG